MTSDNKACIHEMINYCREVAEQATDPGTFIALVLPCVIAMTKSMERDAARIAELQAELREANRVIRELAGTRRTDTRDAYADAIQLVERMTDRDATLVALRSKRGDK